VARIRAAEGGPECLATAPRTTCALADGATSAGAIYMLRASALRPQADGVTGAGFALAVEVLPDSPTGRRTEDSPKHPGIIHILTLDPFIHKDSVLFVWERVVGSDGWFCPPHREERMTGNPPIHPLNRPHPDAPSLYP
jgi:hypothetical protein